MQVRFSLTPLEVEFLGTGQEYASLAASLKMHSGDIDVCQLFPDPRPYLDFATELRIDAVLNQKVAISLDAAEKKIVIQGSEPWLDALACNIESFGNGSKQGEHSHVEYFQGHFYLAPNSVPCVLSLVK